MLMKLLPDSNKLVHFHLRVPYSSIQIESIKIIYLMGFYNDGRYSALFFGIVQISGEKGLYRLALDGVVKPRRAEKGNRVC